MIYIYIYTHVWVCIYEWIEIIIWCRMENVTQHKKTKKKDIRTPPTNQPVLHRKSKSLSPVPFQVPPAKAAHAGLQGARLLAAPVSAGARPGKGGDHCRKGMWFIWWYNGLSWNVWSTRSTVNNMDPLSLSLAFFAALLSLNPQTCLLGSCFMMLLSFF